jgi:hypothetical protein
MQKFKSFLLFIVLLLPLLSFPSPSYAANLYCEGNQLRSIEYDGTDDRLIKECADKQLCEDNGTTASCVSLNDLLCEYFQNDPETGAKVMCKGTIHNGQCEYDDRIGASCSDAKIGVSGGGTSTVSKPDLGPGPAGLNDIETLFKRIVQGSVGLAFIAIFIVLVIAGIKFVTSGGEPKALAAAREAIVWALLGGLFLAIAWLVIQLIAAFTGIDALKIFNIKVLTK